MKLGVEKPGTPEELVHFGVKGMKWGVRRTEGTHDFHARFPTAGQRAHEIRRARKSVKRTERKFRREEDPHKRAELRKVHLNNPDKATALRLTRGEKVVLGLLYSTSPTVVVPAAVAGFTLARVGKRRGIED